MSLLSMKKPLLGDKEAEVKLNKFVCNLCEKVFEKKVMLVNHRKHIHTVRSKEMYCDFCDQTFDSKMDLYSHISSKHAEHFIKTETENSVEVKEEGEDLKEVIVLNDESGSYQFSSWGPSGEGERDGFSFAGKNFFFTKAVLEFFFFNTNKEYNIENVKFC